MSGGFFERRESNLQSILHRMAEGIDANRPLTKDTIQNMAKTASLLAIAYGMLRELDLLFSDDIGEEEYNKRIVDFLSSEGEK